MVTTDHGHQFESALWGTCWDTRTTAYRLIANERFQNYTKGGNHSPPYTYQLVGVTFTVLMEICTVPPKDLGCTDAELVYGAT